MHQCAPVVRRAAPPVARALSLALVLIAALAVSGEARAQAMNGSLPGPIGTEDVVRYGERLGLSDGQVQAALKVLDGYRADFDELRAKEIDPYLEEFASMAGFGVPDREVVLESLEKQDRLMARIARLDDRFFDGLALLLSESQLPELPRVKLARERERLSATDMNFAMFAGATPDLAETFRELPLPPGDAGVQVDGIMRSYERRMTDALRTIREESNGLMLKIMDGLTEAGFADMDQETIQQDPEQMTRMMEAMQDIWALAWEDTGEAVATARDLNATTWRRLDAVLPAGELPAWRRAYYQAAYPQLAMLTMQSPSVQWARALQLDDLDDAARSALEAGLSETRRDEQRLLDDGTEIIDETMGSRSPFDFDPGMFQALQEKIGELRERAETLRAESTERLATIAGEDWRQRLPRDAMGPEGVPLVTAAPQDEAAARERAEAMRVEMEERQDTWSMAPRRLGTRTLRAFAELLELTPDEQRTLFDLHRDYLGAWRDDEAFTAANRAGSFQGYEGKSGDEAARDVRSALGTSVDAARTHDAAFFDRVASELPDVAASPRFAALKRLRARDRDRAGGNTMFMPNARGGGIGAVDLVALVLREVDDAELVDRALDALASWEQEVAGLLASRRAAAIEMQAGQARWMAEMQNLESGEMQDAMELSQRMQEILGAAQTTFNERDEAVGEVNRRHVDALLEAMAGTDAAMPLRSAWRKQAYPQVYDDPIAVIDPLRASLELDGLREDQRERLIEVLAEYQPAYEAICDELVERLAERARFNPADWQNVDWAEWRAKQQELTRLVEQRRELSVRAGTRLKSILDDAQLLEIGPLPDPEEIDTTQLMFW